MIKEARGTGATIDEAKEMAVAALGAGIDDDIQFEVISTPKKKMFGLFGGCKAEVRVYIEVPDEKPKKAYAPKNAPAPAKKSPAAEKPVRKEVEKPVQKSVTNPAAKPAEKSVPKSAANVPAAQSAQAPEKAGKPAVERTSVQDDYKDAVDASQIAPDSRSGKAVAYLKIILAQLGCSGITIKVAEKENGAFIILDGERLGVIIGHRGETLDSLQYLTGLAANNGGGYFKVSLNIGNYREKREQTLISLANRVAAQVLRTGHSRSLEPMNPYERRIIHTAVQDIEGVVSNSFGEGSGRRVVIAPEGGDTRPPRREDGPDRRSGRGGRGHGGHDRERKPSNTVASSPSREPKKDSDIPLYGKIN